MQHDQLEFYIYDDLLDIILGFIPYFYQWKFKRVNKTWKKTITRLQKRVLSERFRNAPRPDRIEHITSNELRKGYVQLNDLALVEKKDWNKFRMNLYLRNSTSAISFLKQFYYLDNLQWVVTQNDNQEDSLMTCSQLKVNYFISLTLIGLAKLDDYIHSYIAELKSIGISLVYFLFCSPSITLPLISSHEVLIKISNDGFSYCTSNNCQGLIYYKKSNFKSALEITKYSNGCSRAFGVHVSWIPRISKSIRNIKRRSIL